MNKAYLETISRSGLFKYLKPSQFTHIWEALNITSRRYPAGQTIYGQDEPVTRAAIVHTGLIRGERLTADGNSNVVYYYHSGESFAFEGALSGKKTSPLHISADTNAEVLFFDVDCILSGAHDPALTRGLFELLANDDIKKLYRIETLSRRSLRDRIMSHFHILASRSGGDSFVLDMSREQLAQYLCVNRSALSHELNQMKRDDIIAFHGRAFRILDR